MKNHRHQVWVNRFQYRLFVRVCFYWLIYQVTVLNFLFIWKLLQEGAGNPFQQYFSIIQTHFPAFFVMAIIVPLLAWDAVKFAHRLVGPVVRFRKSMQDIADGKQVAPIKLRKGDFLGEMRDDFNLMLKTLQSQEKLPNGEDKSPAHDKEPALIASEEIDR